MRKHGNERTSLAVPWVPDMNRQSHLPRLQQTIARSHQDERKGSDLSYLGPVVAHFRISSLHCLVTVARVLTRALPTHAFPYNGKMPSSNNAAATNHRLCILRSTAKRTTTGQRGAAGYLRALHRHLRIMEFVNAGGGCHRRGRDAAPQSPTTAISRRRTERREPRDHGFRPASSKAVCGRGSLDLQPFLLAPKVTGCDAAFCHGGYLKN
ncbi:hypothetical protein BDP55DRAFT_627209 [Colletotrichum godetiae]|uniref:Uncharacterized protein n=1 Tax=Colletotrichum godetiae TaxID=1209918 RepID=A0AAJ0AZ78_9PEZI|nr:uncharacterized protein BDP55DRAFT_627209 [Colletotrichum godetiae]KAK1691565.1 hypothetical protein BDP55DRAFT_627209 [Colletotrichum godetiae]